MTRRWAWREDPVHAPGRCRAPGVVKPGTSALVESTMNRSTPSSPSRAKARRSVSRLSSGSWSILKSPVCSTVPAGVRTATASASGIEWLTAMNSQSKAPSRSRWPSRTVSEYGVIRCSLSFASTSARVSCEPIRGMSGRSLSRYGTAPMWSSWPWVRIDRLDVAEPVGDVVEVGQDQVDARLVVLGEEDAAVDDEQPAVVLEHGHVAADLAETAEGHDPERARRELSAARAAWWIWVTEFRSGGGRHGWPTPGPRSRPPGAAGPSGWAAGRAARARP